MEPASPAIPDKLKEWSYHENLVKEDKHLNDAEKETVLASFDRIKRIMGEDFLKRVVETRNPVMQYFLNTAPWTRFWLVDFSNMLSALKDSPNVEKLQSRLAAGKEYNSAVSELEVAHRFKKAGFFVEFYVKHGKRDCDLRVTKGKTELYVEVANVGWSVEELKAFHILDMFSPPSMTNREVRIGGKIYKILSRPRIVELKKQLDACIQEAKQKQRCIFLDRPGIVDLIICPRSRSDQMSRWLKKRSLSSDLEGPSFDVDEVKRVIRMFREKIPQLPKDKPGLIVLFPARLFAKGDLVSFGKLAYRVEEEIYEHRNLVAGALVLSGLRGSSEKGKFKDDFFWSKKTKHQFFGENTLVIRNKYSDFPLSKEIISALIS
jgi:hypothetical protein